MEWSDLDAAGSDGRIGSGVDARERHKLAERERRKSMRELFLSLHSLLPHANTVRREQSAILDEIIKYIPLAVARLRSLKNRKNAQPVAPKTSTPKVHISDRHPLSSDCDIRIPPDQSSSVTVRVRGDHVSVSLTDTKGSSQKFLLSAIIDELEVHHLDLVRSTYCLDGSKLLHHSESKIIDGSDRSPTLLKERLQDLACKLHSLRKSSSSSKRSFDQID
ncbi:transcription factor bHLH94-like [Magnolia sinica]|uniref:transcription factor bHLH94-like n=1 Tax=Magnolia sinica TaxID=86752 RepID=UPI00265A009D|nr:transcription factor bHLH94-like [Magnolia sinica]